MDSMRDADIVDLPVEVITKIFCLLPIEDRLLSLPLVCRSWRFLARLPDCFREVDARTWCEHRILSVVSDATSEEFLLSASGGCKLPQDELVRHVVDLSDGHLSVLRVSHCSISSIDELASRCRNLIQLEVRQLQQGSIDSAVADLTKKCRYLRRLTINPLYYECPGMVSVITDASLVSISHSCRSLEELDINGCRGVTRAGLISLIRGCRRLKSLSVDHCLETVDADLVATCLADNCPELEKVSFARCGIGERGVAGMARSCPLLQRLNLGCCQDLTRVWGSSSARFRNLTELVVAENRWFSDEHLKLLAAAECGPLLRAVDFRLTGVSDAGLVPFVDTCRGLMSLDGSFCEITDASMRAINDCCKGLETLRMVLTLMTDDSLIGIAKNLRRLTCLHYVPRKHCRTVCNSTARMGTELLFRNCCRIRSLELGVTDLEAAPQQQQQRTENVPSSGSFSFTANTRTSVRVGAVRSSSLPGAPQPQPQQVGLLQQRGLASLTRSLTAAARDDVNIRCRRAGVSTDFYSYTLFQAVAQLGSGLEEVILRGPVDGGRFVDLNCQLRSFARRCPNVKAVGFHALPSLTDETVVALAAAWPLLERAAFTDCQYITSASLKALVCRCRSFRRLRIQNCRGVGSRVLYGDLRQGLPSSREVFLSANGTVYS